MNLIISALKSMALILMAAVITSCSRQPVLNDEISEIDRLTWTDPDSAYSLLCRFDKSDLDNSRDSAMYRLLWAELRDKTYHDDTIPSEISKASLYFRLNDDHYNAMRAFYYQGRIDQNAGLLGQSIISFMEALEHKTDNESHNAYYKGKIFTALSNIYRTIGDEPKEELFARYAYEEFCKLDSAVFIVESKLWWATTLCQTGNPKKGAALAEDIYKTSQESSDSQSAVEALLIMANAALRNEEFWKAKAYYNHLTEKYDYDMSSNDLNLFMWALTKSASPQDSIEMVYQMLTESLSQEDVTYEYYVNKGDYENATMALMNELSETEEKFRMRLRNDAGVSLDNWHEGKLIESNLNVRMLEERTVWIMTLSLLCLALVVSIWLVYRFKMKSHLNKLVKDMLLLKEEGRQYEIREKQLKAEVQVYRASIESSRSTISSTETHTEKSNALELWFKNIDGLYRQYFLTDITEKNKKGLAAAIRNEIEYLRNDAAMLTEMERHINAANNNILTNLYASLNRITVDQRRLVVFLYFGLSVEAICAVFNIDPSALYNRKSRLLSRLNTSTLKNKEEIINTIIRNQ